MRTITQEIDKQSHRKTKSHVILIHHQLENIQMQIGRAEPRRKLEKINTSYILKKPRKKLKHTNSKKTSKNSGGT